MCPDVPPSSSDPKDKKKPQLKHSAHQYGRTVRFMIETDYRDKLSEADAEFLDKFNEAWAGNNPQYIYEDQEKRREVWRNTKRFQRNEAMNGAIYGVAADNPGANPEDAMIEMIDRHRGREEARVAEEERDERQGRIAEIRQEREAKEKSERGQRRRRIIRRRAGA